ncbi:tetratricopeptide repeat protein [Micromonospora sp. WMMD1102]|uniref:tetratricopeptide repeat protein n=1 Tax=Micromonospora sp. WMMD1102 TaxID=3016105 RepID=UPI0024151BC1|nr:tetratricopeptide repeat protein [Micromonospora sp. WMMD1102]MDG4791398.1 tetratricopeptide repeat protein [Micromonospora sp. WMMD1102]
MDRRLSELSLQVAQRHGDETGEMRSLASLVRIDAYDGRFDEAKHRYERAFAINQRLGDHGGEAMLRLNVGLTHHFAREPDLAIEQFHAALALADHLPNGDAFRGAVLLNLGEVYTCLGDWKTASVVLRESHNYRVASGDPAGQAMTLVALGLTLTALGQPDDADQHFEAGLELCERTGNPTDEVNARIGRAGLRLLRVRWRAAPRPSRRQSVPGGALWLFRR